jgi:hypothetical protein
MSPQIPSLTGCFYRRACARWGQARPDLRPVRQAAHCRHNGSAGSIRQVNGEPSLRVGEGQVVGRNAFEPRARFRMQQHRLLLQWLPCARIYQPAAYLSCAQMVAHPQLWRGVERHRVAKPLAHPLRQFSAPRPARLGCHASTRKRRGVRFSLATESSSEGRGSWARNSPEDKVLHSPGRGFSLPAGTMRHSRIYAPSTGTLPAETFSYPPHRFFHSLAMMVAADGDGEAHVALAMFTIADTRYRQNARLFQQLLGELDGGHAAGRRNPHVEGGFGVSAHPTRWTEVLPPECPAASGRGSASGCYRHKAGRMRQRVI